MCLCQYQHLHINNHQARGILGLFEQELVLVICQVVKVRYVRVEIQCWLLRECWHTTCRKHQHSFPPPWATRRFCSSECSGDHQDTPPALPYQPRSLGNEHMSLGLPLSSLSELQQRSSKIFWGCCKETIIEWDWEPVSIVH